MGKKHLLKSATITSKPADPANKTQTVTDTSNHRRSKQKPKQQQQQVKKERLASKQRIEKKTGDSKSSTAPNQPSENLSFCGCGFLGIYHVGVASCFHEYAPQLSMHKISGSSAGAIVAVAHMCGNLQLAYSTTGFLRIADNARARSLGPFHPSFDINAIIRDALEGGLPEDVHMKVSGKLHISLTRAYDGENVVISKFDSKEDVIQALICSCFIPFWSGLVAPKYKGVSYIDGGFSNNLLILDDKTITVSPFAGEADICPQDDVSSLYTVNLSNTSFSVTPHNLYRLSHALLPPPPEILSELYERGFADGIRFLQRMKLITCARCLEIKSSISSSSGVLVQHETTTEIIKETFTYTNKRQRRNSSSTTSSYDKQQQQEHYDTSSLNSYSESDLQEQEEQEDDCDGCLLRSQNAHSDPLPKQFSDRFREACENVNKSLSNWLYSHRPIKYLSYLAAPYYLPLNISIALVLKYWQQLPSFGAELIHCVYDLKNFIGEILKRFTEKSTASILMSPSSLWRDEETIVMKQQESSISVKITADCRKSTMRSLTTFDFCLTIVLFGRNISTHTANKCVNV